MKYSIACGVLVLAAASVASSSDPQPGASNAPPKLETTEDLKLAREAVESMRVELGKYEDWLIAVIEGKSKSLAVKRGAVDLLATLSANRWPIHATKNFMLRSNARPMGGGLSPAHRSVPYPYVDLMANSRWNYLRQLLEEVVSRKANDIAYIKGVVRVLRSWWHKDTARAIVVAEQTRLPAAHRGGFDRLLKALDESKPYSGLPD